MSLRPVQPLVSPMESDRFPTLTLLQSRGMFLPVKLEAVIVIEQSVFWFCLCIRCMNLMMTVAEILIIWLIVTI